MKLRSLFLLFLFLIALACTPHAKVATNKNDLETWALKGKVKNLSEINYAANGKYTTKLIFNIDGNVINQSSFNSDGSLIRRWENEYEKGLKKLRRCYVKNDSLSYTLLYNYATDKNLVSSRIVYGDSLSEISAAFEYDADNNLVKETTYGKDGAIEGTLSNKYNQDKRLVESEKHDLILKSSIIQDYQYNARGLKTEESFYRPNDKKRIQRISYQYGALNKPVSITTYGPEDQILEKRTFKYDPNENIVETLILDDKQVQKKQTTTYTYDQHGNWVRSIVRNEEETNMIIERKYDYYN
jgi:hypothetical protein